MQNPPFLLIFDDLNLKWKLFCLPKKITLFVRKVKFTLQKTKNKLCRNCVLHPCRIYSTCMCQDARKVVYRSGLFERHQVEVHGPLLATNTKLLCTCN